MTENEAMILFNQSMILTGLSAMVQHNELSDLLQAQAQRTKDKVEADYNE